MGADHALHGSDGAPHVSTAQISHATREAMVAAPVLIERPFVFTPKGVRLCRPPETVLELL